MKTISLLLLSLMLLGNSVFAAGRANSGAMSQDNVHSITQNMKAKSDHAAAQNAQPKTDTEQEQTKADDNTKQ